MARKIGSGGALVTLIFIGILIYLYANHTTTAIVLTIIFVSLIGLMIATAKPGRCGICGNDLKKKSYQWELEVKKVTVCPNCNRELEKKRSRDAVKKYLDK